MRQDDIVYIISPDDFEQLRADVILHRSLNKVLEATERDDMITMKLSGITYCVSKDIFLQLKEFWDSGNGAATWHC